MQLSDIICKFQLSAPLPKLATPTFYLKNLKSSAVLLPLVEEHGKASLLLCKRAASLRHHPSQICFPGGKVEKSDTSIISTALRETHEELGIEPKHIETIGQMPIHQTLTGFNIVPIVAKLSNAAQWNNTSAEVDQVFTVPLSQLFNHANWQEMPVQFGGEIKQFEVYSTPYGLLWGATAKLIKNFAQLSY